MTVITPEIALAVLNAGMQANMVAQGAIPEADSDKVAEATRIVDLAKQARNVADAIGRSNVPMWPLVEAVLREAGESTELNGSNGQAAAPAPAQQPAPVSEPPPPAPAPVQVQAPETPAEPSITLQGPPQPPAVPDPSIPQRDERWVDANGGYWDITQYGGGPQLEARSVATGEKTVLPAGFLKQRASRQPITQEQAPPAAAPVEQPVQEPPPASPVPESTPEPTPAAQAPPAEPEPQPAPAAAPDLPAPPSAQQPVQAPVIDDHEGDPEYEGVLDTVQANYAPMGMPVPMDLERDAAPMPEDLTGVSDMHARALHSQFNALAARARYLRGLESAKARACARVRKHYMKEAMRYARQQMGKDASVTEVSQLAEEDENVASWITRENRHADRAEAYDDFLKMYSEDVSVLSRDWTMRDREEKTS